MTRVNCLKKQAGGGVVKDTPLIFSDVMVRALLEGRKWQTRRLVGAAACGAYWDHSGYEPFEVSPRVWSFRNRGAQDMAAGAPVVRCRYGTAGDRVWVREAWNVAGVCYGLRPSQTGAASAEAWRYRADDGTGWKNGWRPSIHMPRWASRLEFGLFAVGLHRLQEITESQARAEGVEKMRWFEPAGKGVGDHYDVDGIFRHASSEGSYRNGFATLWERIYGPGAWEANSWVWALNLMEVKK